MLYFYHMFDDVPQNQSPQPQPVPPAGNPPLPGTGSPPMSPFVKPVTSPSAPVAQKATGAQVGAPPLPATAIPNTYADDDVEMLEMFKRETLSPVQKTILVVVTILVIAALIGGGIGLYFWLDPFSAEEDVQSNENQNSNAVENVIENVNNVNTVPVTEQDTDGDGIKDATEKKYGTDPGKTDTDGDELSDYDEIEVYKTKPLIQDTDGDTYVDGNEVKNGYDPNGPGKLNE